MASGVKRIPLIGSLINRNPNPDSFNTKDQIFTNCYPEIVSNAVTRNTQVFLNKRPGYTSSAALAGVVSGAGSGLASALWFSNSAVTAPTAIGMIDTTSTSTSVWNASAGGGPSKIGGSIPTTSDVLSITDVSVNLVGTLVGLFKDSSTASTEAWFFHEGGAWTQIASTNFPVLQSPSKPLAGANAVAHMDGYSFYFCQNGEIWNTDINTVSTFGAASFVAAQSFPGDGVGLARYKNLIVAFKNSSIEFFQNSGLSPAPLTRVGNAVTQVGALLNSDESTILSSGDTVYWLGRDNNTGAQGVYRLNGFSPDPISTPAINKLVTSGVLNSILGSFVSHGMSHILFSGASGISYAYCVPTGQWWRAVFTNVPRTIIGNLGANYWNSSGTSIFSSNEASPVYQDASVNYTWTVQTANQDFGSTKLKKWLRVKPVCDIQTTTCRVDFGYSDDDYLTSTLAGTVEVSSQIQVEYGLTRLGSSHRRSWKMESTDNSPFRGEAIELEYEIVK